MTDEILCKKIKNGSHKALSDAITRFTPYVSTVAWRVLASSSATKEDLEEIVADTFLALWNHASEINPANIRPWLAAVSRNRAIDKLRTLTPIISLSENDPDTTPGPEDTALQRDRAEKLWKAVNNLSEPDRTLFIRHYYEGEKIDRIAQDLDMNPSTAKTRLHRGRKLLKSLLEKEGILRETEPEQVVV